MTTPAAPAATRPMYNCEHEEVTIDEDQEIMTCDDCGAVCDLDAW